MRGVIFLLLSAVALSSSAVLNHRDCLSEETVNILHPHANCNKYYQCDAGKYIVRKCQENLLFNVRRQRCDWPRNVVCEGSVDSGSDENDNESSAPEPEPEDNNGGAGNNDPSEAANICATDNSDGILIAHEYCNKFYKCFAGEPVAMSCPTELYFNPDKDQCDFPTNVDCNREVAPGPAPEPEGSNESDNGNENSNENNNSSEGGGHGNPDEAPSICAADDSNGILVAHEYCNKFYICFAGKPVAMRCPGELFFNPSTNQCDYQDNVNCDREVAPGPAPEPEDSNESDNGNENSSEDRNSSEGGGHGNPDEAPSICAADGSDGILVAHEYCNKFYICFAGKPVAMRCPGELFFNPSTDQCDYRDNVNCDREVAPGPAPKPEDSNESDSGNENNDSSEGGGHGNPDEAPSICAADDSNGILVAHEYCNKFYICFAGKPVAMRCPGELFFNPSTDQCDYRDNVNCDREVAPGPAPEPEDSNESDNSNENSSEDSNSSEGGGHGNPDEAPSICAADGSDGILVAHEYCNKFYICFAGKPVAMRCPGELFFNPSTDQCDYRDNVNCDREVAPGPAPKPEDSNESDSGNENNNSSEGGGHGNPDEAPSICAADDSDGILVAHEYCNQFYICFAGKPVAMRCPGELFFNPSTDQCDYRDNVNCDREVAPGPAPEPEDSNESDNSNENSSEDSNSSEGGGHGNPDEAPSICAADGSDGILVAHKYCNKFYICFAGKPVAMRCPGELFFNPSTDQCDYRDNVNCDREVAPGPAPKPEDSNESDSGNENNNSSEGGGHGNPDEAPSICAADDSNGILVAHEYCNKFYICFAGKPVAMRCPGELFFNPSTDQCDYRDNVNCDREVAPGPAPEPEDSNESDNSIENSSEDSNSSEGGSHGNPDEAPSICAADGSNGILVAHEYCNKFYICFAGKPVAMRCPGELFFNPSTDQCDYRDNVNCDREVAPGPAPKPEDSNESDSGNENNNSSEGGGHGNPDEAPSICAADDSNGILVAHEYCNKFYICFAGKPVAMRCPGELFFNPSTDQCDYRDNVNCDREVAPGPAPEPEESNESDNSNENSSEDSNSSEGGGHGNPDEAPSICAADGSNGILVAHEYCNKFYICFAGKPIPMRCPGELFFNPSTDQCDYRENVNCDREVAPGPAPEPEDSNESDNDNENSGEDGNGSEGGGHGNPDEAHSICAADGSDGILVAHEYCNKFYICFAGKPVGMRCPGGLFFNPSTDQCDYRDNVNCDREVAPGPAPEPEDSNENDNGNENSGEDSNDSEGGGHGNPDEAPSICAADGSDGILVAHEYCNKFYICFAGKPVALRCPGELFFNPSTDQCDYRDNVNCDREVAPGPAPKPEDSNESDSGNENNNSSEGGGHGNPDEAPSICAADGSNGILVAHEYCNQFYICFAGKPVAMRCPGELFFNPSTDQCDYRDNVHCDREVAPGPAPEPEDSNESDNSNENSSEDSNSSEGGGHGNPDEAPSICAADGSDGILVAHEYCNKFYKCHAGKPVALSCPNNLFFNPGVDQCDWPNNVDCDRGVSTAPPPKPDNSDENDNDNGNDNENDSGDNNGSTGGGNSDPGEAETLCAAGGSDSVLVAHENCNQFQICHKGKPYTLSCPHNLFFNPQTDQCDWPENVNCDRDAAPVPAPNPDNGDTNEDNSSGDGNSDISEAENLCAAEESDGILVAHENCNQFYKCSEGKLEVLTCPLNLLYNPSKELCDWPENVDCQGRYRFLSVNKHIMRRAYYA